MFKLLLLLCLMILATLLTLGGRGNGPVRDGLAGKIPPLVYVGHDSGLAEPVVVAAVPVAAKAPANAPAEVRNASVPDPVAKPVSGPEISAAFAAADAALETDQGLTLALPPTENGVNPALQAAADPAPQDLAVPTVRYVTGNAVNLRAGPSAGSDSLTKLNRGNAVLVLPSDTPGWSNVRIEESGLEGYIATRFLGDRPQDGIFTPVN